MLQREDLIDIAGRIAGLGFGLWDERTGTYLFASKEFAGVYGMTPEEYLAHTPTYEEEVAFVHPDDRARYDANYRSYLENPRECSIEVRVLESDGSFRHTREFYAPIFDDSGALIQTVIVELHISELKRAEEALRQAQKMEAVGQLTGGIAHDFNNLLAVIVGNLELLSGPGANASDARELVDTAIAAAERGIDLTRRLLSLSRRQPAVAEPVDLCELAEGLLDLLRRSLGSEIEISVKGPTDLWPCRVDRGQFENSLLNLALNSRDAMNGEGTIAIKLSNVELAEDYNVAESAMSPGQYVCVAITDTGIGMSSEIAERAMEPFFTTKDVGSGSGLGLSMVYGFAKQSGGHLVISSEVDRGTTVKIYIPRYVRPSNANASDRASDESLEARGECVLLVDDDDSVLTMTTLILEALGYEVKAVQSAHEALGVLGVTPRIDLLITDVMLGGGYSGPEMAREIGRRSPDLPVLFVSGYPQKKLQESGFVGTNVSFLAKPFRKLELARAIRATIAGK